MSKKRIQLDTRPIRGHDPSKLIIGGDDSNHFIHNPRGDIIVAVFSGFQRDSVVYDFSNRRDSSRVKKWFGLNNGRSFLFTLVHDEDLRRSQGNVCSQMPKLAGAHILRTGQRPKEIKCYVDGVMHAPDKRMIREGLGEIHGVKEVVVDNFIKGRNGRKGPRCPAVVYVADTVANSLYGLTFQELTSHERYVP